MKKTVLRKLISIALIFVMASLFVFPIYAEETSDLDAEIDKMIEDGTLYPINVVKDDETIVTKSDKRAFVVSDLYFSVSPEVYGKVNPDAEEIDPTNWYDPTYHTQDNPNYVYFFKFDTLYVCTQGQIPIAVAVINEDGTEQYVSFSDCNPFLENSKTYVPVRAVCELLGAELGWDDTTETASIKKDSKEMWLTIGDRFNTTTEDGIQFKKNAMQVAPILRNGRTCVTIRDVLEFFGYEVSWVEGKAEKGFYYLDLSGNEVNTIYIEKID